MEGRDAGIGECAFIRDKKDVKETEENNTTRKGRVPGRFRERKKRQGATTATDLQLVRNETWGMFLKVGEAAKEREARRTAQRSKRTQEYKGCQLSAPEHRRPQ